MEISNIITKRRKELHMTQRELAEKLNVTDKTVSRWEVSKSYPDATTLPALAKALDVSIDELFGDTSKVVLTTNEDDKVDHNRITKFKIYSIVSLALLIAGFIIFLVDFIVYMNFTEPVAIVLFVISLLLMIVSIVLMVVGTMLYKSFYKEKFYTKVYKKELAKWVITYVNTFVILLSLIPMFSMFVGGIYIAILIIFVAEIVMAIIFEKNSYNLSVKNKRIFYITSAVIFLLSILLGLLIQYFGREWISIIPFLLLITTECIMTFSFYGYKAVIKE